MLSRGHPTFEPCLLRGSKQGGVAPPPPWPQSEPASITARSIYFLHHINSPAWRIKSRHASWNGPMANTSSSAEYHRRKLYTRVVSDIERRVLSRQLQVGQRLPSEAELARVYDVSTRSVREALQILETKGLIRRRHGELAEVVRDDLDQFIDTLAASVGSLIARDTSHLVQVMDVRRMIELDVVGRLAAGEGRLSMGVSSALDKMRSSARENNHPQFTEGDTLFHCAIVQSLGNDIYSLLYNNINSLMAGTVRIFGPVPRQTLVEAQAEHEEIYSHIRDGNAQRARALMGSHIDNYTAHLQTCVGSNQYPENSRNECT